MSLVCHNWSEGFYSPSVCKAFRFDLTDSQLSKDTCPVMEFVRKCSSMFRHVEINCNFSMKKRLLTTWCRHFIEFLQILTSNSQLLSVNFQNLVFCFGPCFWICVDTPTYKNTCRAIAEFLGSQRHLKRAEFHYCSFGFNEGVEVLRKLTEHSRESLTHLVLEDFVRWKSLDREQDSNCLRHLPKLAILSSLTTLETDYSLIFENMVASHSNDIQAIKSCQKRVLSKIILKYCDDPMEIEDFRGLKSTDWRFLKILCPDLQVDLSIITDSATRRKVEFFIVPNMPITRLFYINDTFDDGIEIAVLFDHLLACKTNVHLVTLHLVWMLPIQHLSSTFIPFLQACKKLKCLELFIIPPTNGIDLLMKSWLENRPESLEKVIIDISCIRDEEDYPSLMNFTAEYVSLLKLAGLNIRVDLHI
ncbi:hypothetical protein AVEN_116610-1 [Araneus ventricosus]|uniref:F-box domain-containing protein n=1 Tax=Araneus ventricosus TaxID=182803 RepID=A0A4Y2DFG0_ARAVE|nr:hypothetical protein AVEN_116610-1 [Araneus ventricosus]